jgi:esterase/lipase
MKLIQTSTRIFFKITSLIAPAMAANIAFQLFQTTRKKVRSKERDFFQNSTHFHVPGNQENIDCYELGNPKGEIVFLVHGWESNAGSMSAIAAKLASLNYRVIAFNFPAHGTSNLKKANLLVCSHAFLNVLGYIKPKDRFSVVGHSFGSAVSAYTLSKVDMQINKIMFLTTPNRISDIFSEFRKMIGLGESSYKLLLQKAQALLGEDPADVNVEDKMKMVKFSQLLILHDLFDKVLAHKNSLNVHKAISNSRMVTTFEVGHYRMLWDEKVLDQIEQYFSPGYVALPKAS